MEPIELAACVCKHLDLPSIGQLLSTCRVAYAYGQRDDFFRIVANLQWGGAFWEKALTRKTHRLFVSMKDELVQMHRFSEHLRRCGSQMWSDKDFERFWDIEARLITSRRPPPSGR